MSKECHILPKPEIKIQLQKLYTRGKENKNKNRRITAEKAYDILHETVIKYDWEQKLTLSVPNIKSFFSKTPEKIEEIMEKWKWMVPERKKITWKTYPDNISDC